MIRRNANGRWFAVGLLLTAGGACSHRERTLADLDCSLTIAVTPALNHSGSQQLDPLRLADLMASELTQLPGVRVIPLNRVLAQLASEQRERVESPDHAQQLRERLGADAIVVMAVTEYDPYSPPVLGLTAQLYGEQRSPGGLDLVAASRRTTPFEAATSVRAPRVEYQRVFHGADRQVEKEMREFVRRRSADDSPYGWRKFLASQDEFLRFCCARIGRELIRQEITQLAALPNRRHEDSGP